MFADLDAGDIVFVDGSHVVTMKATASSSSSRSCPPSRPGVLVGIDDVYLPWDYHPTWAHRFYGEQTFSPPISSEAEAATRSSTRVGSSPGRWRTTPRLGAAVAVRREPFGRLASSFWFERGRSALAC